MHSNWSSLVAALEFCGWNKQTSIIFYCHSLFCPSFNFRPPFMPSSFFGDQEQSPALMGAPLRIELNSWGAEKRLSGFTSLALPPIYLTFPSSPPQWNTGSHAFISLFPDGDCFVLPALPSSLPPLHPGSSLKDYILRRDLNYACLPPCTQHPSHHISVLRWESGAVVLQLSVSPFKSVVSGYAS